MGQLTNARLKEPGGIAIGDLSRRTGVNIETIRYYEKINVLPPPPRTASGRRVYGPAEGRVLAFIRRARELGFTVEEIRGLLGLFNCGYTCGEVQELTVRHLADVRQKIGDLRRIERILRMASEQCAGGTVPQCPIIDALFGEPKGFASSKRRR